jgi:hypothetical protein
MEDKLDGIGEKEYVSVNCKAPKSLKYVCRT